MKKILIFQWFKCNDLQREAELIDCISHNLAIGFDKVIIFNDSVDPKFLGNKIENRIINRRLRYSDFLSIASDTTNNGDLVVLINTDIKLDDKILTMPHYMRVNDFIALSRYESSGELANSHWCTQDVWAIISQPLPDSIIYQSEIPLGIPGCENRIAEVFYTAGFLVFNPCLDIKNLHVHSKQAIYSDSYRIFGSYLFVHSCRLDDIGSENSVRSSLVYFSTSKFGAIQLT